MILTAFLAILLIMLNTLFIKGKGTLWHGGVPSSSLWVNLYTIHDMMDNI